jgi:uncharacterized membrane protein (Fun14 family)
MNEQPEQPIGKTIAQVGIGAIIGYTLGYIGCYAVVIFLAGLCFLTLLVASAFLR